MALIKGEEVMSIFLKLYNRLLKRLITRGVKKEIKINKKGSLIDKCFCTCLFVFIIDQC